MKRLFLALSLLICGVVNASAGSLTFTYKDTAGTVSYAASATISDADAKTILALCQVKYAATVGSDTAKGCFNIYANDIFNQIIAGEVQAEKEAAASAAAASVAPPVVTLGQ